MGGDAIMRSWIERLGAMRDFDVEVAREAAPEIEKIVKATAAAGTTPEGEAWKPTKDGKRPLANAAHAVSARAVGAVVQILLHGVEVIHNKGAGKTLPARRILPASAAELPPAITKALEDAAARVFRRTMGGR